MSDLAHIVVTGAAGKTGRAVVRALSKRGVSVRAFVRRPAQATSLRLLGVEDVIDGDMRDPAAWHRALAGAGALYLICPNMAPDEYDICDLAFAAAEDAGVERVVYHSVLHPQIEEMAHHWNKLKVEQRLFRSGLRWTVLQPAAYMQNVFAGWDGIVRDGIYGVPYPPETRLGMVDLRDVAEVAALVLMELGHEGALYELAGSEVLTQTDVAKILTVAVGRSVRVEQIARGEWERSARASGLGDWQIQTLLAMFRYYERHGFWGNPHILAWLLGRAPTTFSQAVAREHAHP